MEITPDAVSTPAGVSSLVRLYISKLRRLEAAAPQYIRNYISNVINDLKSLPYEDLLTLQQAKTTYEDVQARLVRIESQMMPAPIELSLAHDSSSDSDDAPPAPKILCQFYLDD